MTDQELGPQNNDQELRYLELNSAAFRLVRDLTNVLAKSPDFADSRIRTYLLLALADPKYLSNFKKVNNSNTSINFKHDDSEYSVVFLQKEGNIFGIRVNNFSPPESVRHPANEDIYILTSTIDASEDAQEALIQYRNMPIKTSPVSAKNTHKAVYLVEDFVNRF